MNAMSIRKGMSTEEAGLENLLNMAQMCLAERRYADAMVLLMEATTMSKAEDHRAAHKMTEVVKDMPMEMEEAMSCMKEFAENHCPFMARMLVRRYPKLLDLMRERGQKNYLMALGFWISTAKVNPACMNCYMCTTMREVVSCYGCGGKEGLKACKKCRMVFYCGRECQAGHWREHKQTCDEVTSQFLMLTGMDHIKLM